MRFAGNSAEDLGFWSSVGVTYLSFRMHLKSCHIFPLKVAATLLSGSRKGAVEHSSHIVKVGVGATC